MIKILITTW